MVKKPSHHLIGTKIILRAQANEGFHILNDRATSAPFFSPFSCFPSVVFLALVFANLRCQMLLFHCRCINICGEGIDLYRRECEAKSCLDEDEGIPEFRDA